MRIPIPVWPTENKVAFHIADGIGEHKKRLPSKSLRGVGDSVTL